MTFPDPRRLSPRIAVDGLCSLVTDRVVSHAALVDLSSSGLRIERPYDPATASGPVQLEIELPGIDEILWAKGHVTFLRLWRGSNAHGRPRYWCRTGIRIERAAGRDRRLIRDYVHAFIPPLAIAGTSN